MDFNDWVADLTAGTATHASGFIIKVEGNPTDPSQVDPGKFPEGLSFIEQARLLRSGLEFLAKEAKQMGKLTSYSTRKDDPKMAAIREREEQAKRFAERADKPERSVLSLKKKS